MNERGLVLLDLFFIHFIEYFAINVAIQGLLGYENKVSTDNARH